MTDEALKRARRIQALCTTIESVRLSKLSRTRQELEAANMELLQVFQLYDSPAAIWMNQPGLISKALSRIERRVEAHRARLQTAEKDVLASSSMRRASEVNYQSRLTEAVAEQGKRDCETVVENLIIQARCKS